MQILQICKYAKLQIIGIGFGFGDHTYLDCNPDFALTTYGLLLGID